VRIAEAYANLRMSKEVSDDDARKAISLLNGSRLLLTLIHFQQEARADLTPFPKVRNLLKLGTHPGVAIPMCLSRKGSWKCARTLATQTGMITPLA
jgi:hypothetical protein